MRRSEILDGVVERLQARGHRTQTGCLLWPGATTGGGYGLISCRGRLLTVHRVAYVLAHGDLEAGVTVRHSCDTPPCYEPTHLLVGTHQQNMDDVWERRWAHRSQRIREVRCAFTNGVSVPDLQKTFGLSVEHLHEIIHNRVQPDPDYTPPAKRDRRLDSRRLRLSWDVVQAAKKEVASGGSSVRALAQKHGVAYSTMHEAIHGRPGRSKRPA